MRDVEGRGIGQKRSSGKRRTSSIIWRMRPAERALQKGHHETHLGVICTQFDVRGLVGGDARGRG